MGVYALRKYARHAFQNQVFFERPVAPQRLAFGTRSRYDSDVETSQEPSKGLSYTGIVRIQNLEQKFC